MSPGEGIGVDFIDGRPFNNPDTALGRPTVDTTGDGVIDATDLAFLLGNWGPCE